MPTPGDRGSIVIREYHSADEPQVVALFKCTQQDQINKADTPFKPPMTYYFEGCLKTDMADLEGTYLTPGGNFWVAVDGEEIVGIVGAEKKSDDLIELRRMAVDASYRRYGIGRRLVDRVETWGRDHGFQTINLHTLNLMDHAQAFYESMGYTLQDERHNILEEPRMTVISYTKRLEK